MAALPQEEVGAAAEAEEGEEEEEEAAGRPAAARGRRPDQGRTHHRLGGLPAQDGPQRAGHALAGRTGGTSSNGYVLGLLTVSRGLEVFMKVAGDMGRLVSVGLMGKGLGGPLGGSTGPDCDPGLIPLSLPYVSCLSVSVSVQ